MTQAEAAPRTSELPGRIAKAAATVALLDMAFVVILFVVIKGQTTVTRILHTIAGGLLGPAAREGGAPTAVLGAFLHVLIATIWTCIFAVAVTRSAALRRAVASVNGALIAGALYGAVMWIGMNHVVIPLSQARPTPVSHWWWWTSLVWHMVALGPPIVFITSRRTG